jgi:predicted membrane protein
MSTPVNLDVMADVKDLMKESKRKEYLERSRKNISAPSKCLHIISVPFMILLVLGRIMLICALFVFAIQALTVGTNTYKNPDCQHTVGVWMIVFGSLSVFFTFLWVVSVVCCQSKIETKEDGKTEEKPNLFLGSVTGLVTLVLWCWIFYGTHLVYNIGSLQNCDPSQLAVFNLMVLFLFWTFIGLLFGFILLYCLFIPVLALIFGGDAEKKAVPGYSPPAADLEKQQDIQESSGQPDSTEFTAVGNV